MRAPSCKFCKTREARRESAANYRSMKACSRIEEKHTKQASSVFDKEQATTDADERIAELERLVDDGVELERTDRGTERLVGRLVLELEESKREPAILGARKMESMNGTSGGTRVSHLEKCA